MASSSNSSVRSARGLAWTGMPRARAGPRTATTGASASLSVVKVEVERQGRATPPVGLGSGCARTCSLSAAFRCRR